MALDAARDSAHERALADEGRRAALGAWYTAPTVVDGLLGLALDPLLADRAGDAMSLEALRVVDPACGDGRFLVASARRIAAALVTAGRSEPSAWRAAVRCVIGVDRDPVAADLARHALAEASAAGGGSTSVEPQIAVGDAVAMEAPPWAPAAVDAPLAFWELSPEAARWVDLAGTADGFDLVVGNPPFKGQLKRKTRGSSQDRATWRQRFGPLVSAFTDEAAYFLLLAEQLARPDAAALALVLPIPLLATRDGGDIRRHLLARTELAHLWVADERTFAAQVEVGAVVLVRPRPNDVDGATVTATATAAVAGSTQIEAEPSTAPRRGTTRLWSRLEFTPGPLAASPTADSATWSGLLATHAGVPERSLAVDGLLGDLASATAGFRDQYYGLTGCVVDQPAASPDRVEPPLVTTGAVDPAQLRWGTTPIRFQKAQLLHPRVQVERLSEAMQRWAVEQLAPKVLVSTQTQVLEAIADHGGELLPSVPLVSVHPRSPDPHELDLIGALLTSPPITMVATRRHAGSGFGGRSLRLSATDLLDLPLPADRDLWDVAATWFRRASEAADIEERHVALVACGRGMNEAFSLGPDLPLLHWWTERLPDRRPRRGRPEPEGGGG